MRKDHIYICVDLKSFYASVECILRNLDPFNTNLVVADTSRTEKTICLAVSPALKGYGVSSRPRLFEVIQKVEEINEERMKKCGRFTGKSTKKNELDSNPNLELDFISATPQMAKYLSFSGDIYNIYLKYIAKEDIHVYSIDEVFIDATKYLKTYGVSARELAYKIVKDIVLTTNITATAGIGTNMYLAKVAMDIVAKHQEADSLGVRIAALDEYSYRKELWEHEPLTDFWRVGPGYMKRLAKYGIKTMGDIARISLAPPTEYFNEDFLYDLFGINAELLIDHAWGYEPCTIEDVKGYVPKDNSVSTGQVIHCAYDYEKTLLVVKEMVDLFVLDLVDKNVTTDQIVMGIGYDIDNLTNQEIMSKYKGEIVIDGYGRKVPQGIHSSINIGYFTNSHKVIMEKTIELFNSLVNKDLLVRRLHICATHVKSVFALSENKGYEQLNLFKDYDKERKEKELENIRKEKEAKAQKTIIEIKKKYGKSAIIKGMNLLDGGTTIDRNKQIGGHKA